MKYFIIAILALSITGASAQIKTETIERSINTKGSIDYKKITTTRNGKKIHQISFMDLNKDGTLESFVESIYFEGKRVVLISKFTRGKLSRLFTPFVGVSIAEGAADKNGTFTELAIVSEDPLKSDLYILDSSGHFSIAPEKVLTKFRSGMSFVSDFAGALKTGDVDKAMDAVQAAQKTQ